MNSQLTDQELLRKAKFYGENALRWRRKFMGLLPEIQRRRLFERKGFSSIFEFSFKLAGLSEEQVRRVLSLEKRFAETPTLKNLLVSGTVSVHKLARVASIASPENEQALAEAVKILPKHALEVFVRDGLLEAKIEEKLVPGHTLKLSAEVTERLVKLQEKGLDLDKLLTEFLDQREQEIAEEKITIAEKLNETHSRYVPVRIKKIIQKEHGSKCSIRTCKKPAQQLHHTQTFSLSHLHDPHYLAPLCKAHHTLAHAINLKVQEKRTALPSEFAAHGTSLPHTKPD